MPESAPPPRLPKAVSQRLSLYLRFLEELESGQKDTVSSSQLARALGLTAAQVRRDLAYFGQFGFPGVGYKVSNLVREIRRILGTDRVWQVALIGAGNLGTALLRYRGFRKQGFEIAAVFDADPKLEGKAVSGVTIRGVRDLGKVVRETGIKIAILAVPAEAAADAAKRCVEAGVLGILNFAPIRLAVPESVVVHAVDLALQLEQLAFRMRLEGPSTRSRLRARSS
ncbi:MAG TPA: redox-sensing transcriptional repressor Rex [Planctomycetota bacterium]|nr:redox-sensing transcriptional repressor Rex [Planctomycetota bacterium]